MNCCSDLVGRVRLASVQARKVTKRWAVRMSLPYRCGNVIGQKCLHSTRMRLLMATSPQLRLWGDLAQFAQVKYDTTFNSFDLCRTFLG